MLCVRVICVRTSSIYDDGSKSIDVRNVAQQRIARAFLQEGTVAKFDFIENSTGNNDMRVVCILPTLNVTVPLLTPY